MSFYAIDTRDHTSISKLPLRHIQSIIEAGWRCTISFISPPYPWISNSFCSLLHWLAHWANGWDLCTRRATLHFL
ncbi:hypothetical protein C8Q74DRAFT_1277469 [Fomes fomentarius]|nr:hypothetical protein C8Q74DRAFT_1277469 [Fomes fomentarius]